MGCEQWFLREIRKELGIVQADLAKAAGVSQARISVLETGRGEPTADEIQGIVRAVAARAAGRAFEQVIASIWR